MFENFEEHSESRKIKWTLCIEKLNLDQIVKDLAEHGFREFR